MTTPTTDALAGTPTTDMASTDGSAPHADASTAASDHTSQSHPAHAFSALGVADDLVASLTYTEPTPIQSALIPVLLDGRDAIGQAQTGTGKTAAFTLPTLQRIDPEVGDVQVLVLVPTRELATQVAGAVYAYGKPLGLSVLPIFGGAPYHRQVKRLRRGVEVVVGTPGRLLDLIGQGALDLSAVQTVILDEADEMLSMGFAEDLAAILDATPAERQTVLISATMPTGIRRLADQYLNDPEVCQVAHSAETASNIEHRHYLVHARDKQAALVRLLETEDVESALVFVRTRAETTQVARLLQSYGWGAEALSGEMTQPARTEVLRRFRAQELRVLVGTDVAARGLDIDHISHVVNVDLPFDAEVFVHRVGRTGRAGRSGVALSLVTPSQQRALRSIEHALRHDIPRAEVPGDAEVDAHRRARTANRLRTHLEAVGADGKTSRALVLDLVAEGHDPMDLAAAALALAGADDNRSIPEVSSVKPRSHRGQRNDRRDDRRGDRRSKGYGSKDGGPKGFRSKDGRSKGPRHNTPTDSHEDGMVRLQISAGKMNGVRPGQVVSALARTANIPGKALGRIVIDYKTTFVDVPQEHVGAVLAQDSYRFGKRTAQVERA
ncbi:MAG: DEAD/DEAH box helicase [Bacteroidota bacterium]